MKRDSKHSVTKRSYKDYPGDWELVELGNLLERVRRPVDVIPDHEYQEIGIRSHGKGLFYKKPVKGSDLGNKAVFWVDVDCLIINIIFAWEQAVGITTTQEKGMIASHRFPMWRSKENVELNFLLNLFLTPLGKHLLGLASPGGAGRNRTLGQDEFNKIPVCIPSKIEEQQKIVKILSTWDKAIELEEHLIAWKKQQKKRLMQNLLTGKKRLPGFKGEWQEIRLGDVCEIVSGGTPDTSITYYWGGEIPWCTPTDITSAGKYINKTQQSITYDGLNNSSASILPAGSVLMCSRATIGPRSITLSSITTNQGFKNFICSNLINNEYLYYYIEVLTPTFIKKASGSTFGEVLKNDVENIMFQLPLLPEQIAIAEILSTADREIDLHKKQLDELKKQKKALMQLLLTGIVKVNVQEVS